MDASESPGLGSFHYNPWKHLAEGEMPAADPACAPDGWGGAGRDLVKEPQRLEVCH